MPWIPWSVSTLTKTWFRPRPTRKVLMSVMRISGRPGPRPAALQLGRGARRRAGGQTGCHEEMAPSHRRAFRRGGWIVFRSK